MIFDSLTFPLTHCIPGDIFRCHPSCHGVRRDAKIQHLLQQKDGRLPLIRLPDPNYPSKHWQTNMGVAGFIYPADGENMPLMPLHSF